MREYDIIMKNINKLGIGYAKRACQFCGRATILRPIGIEFLDKGISPVEIPGYKLPKLPTLSEALQKAEVVHKVCLRCHFGEPILKTDIHYWN